MKPKNDQTILITGPRESTGQVAYMSKPVGEKELWQRPQKSSTVGCLTFVYSVTEKQPLPEVKNYEHKKINTKRNISCQGIGEAGTDYSPSQLLPNPTVHDFIALVYSHYLLKS